MWRFTGHSAIAPLLLDVPRSCQGSCNTGLFEIIVAGPYKFIGFGDIDVDEPYEFIWFGGIDDPGPQTLPAAVFTSQTPVCRVRWFPSQLVVSGGVKLFVGSVFLLLILVHMHLLLLCIGQFRFRLY